MSSTRDYFRIQSLKVCLMGHETELVQKRAQTDDLDKVLHQGQNESIPVAVWEGGTTRAGAQDHYVRAPKFRWQHRVSILA